MQLWTCCDTYHVVMYIRLSVEDYCKGFETTYVYAYADTEQKRLAIEKSTATANPLKQAFNSERYALTDENTIRRLYGLK